MFGNRIHSVFKYLLHNYYVYLHTNKNRIHCLSLRGNGEMDRSTGDGSHALACAPTKVGAGTLGRLEKIDHSTWVVPRDTPSLRTDGDGVWKGLHELAN